MKSGKKKSSGWRPANRRGTEHQARRGAAQEATARRDCDRLGLWRSCPVRQCRRVARCGGEPLQCLRRGLPVIAPHRNAGPRASNAAAEPAVREQAVAPVMSAAEAAAAIKASIAALPPEPFAGEELEAVIRDGRVQYLPRRR
jgi:hypothetical protein